MHSDPTPEKPPTDVDIVQVFENSPTFIGVAPLKVVTMGANLSAAGWLKFPTSG